MKTGVRDQVNELDGASYFKLFAELLKTNPPAADDAPMVAKLAKIGVVQGKISMQPSSIRLWRRVLPVRPSQPRNRSWACSRRR